MYNVTIAKVEGGYKIEPTGRVAASLQEVHRWVRANFQVIPEERSKLEQELESSGKTSIERRVNKFRS